jgi:hypothetical protein
VHSTIFDASLLLNTRWILFTVFPYSTISSTLSAEALRQRRGGSAAGYSESQHAGSLPAALASASFRHDESHVAANDPSTVEMSFEQLKREAAALERQLEEKLSRYQQVRRRGGCPLSTVLRLESF